VGFYGTPEAKQHFPNLIDGMWTLWIAVTTANYPDVMMPAYNRNRLAALYFVVFMAITFFFLMNVILASVVNAYDNELDRRRIASKQTSQRELHEAFALLQKNGVIDRDTVMALFLILNDDFPEFRLVYRL
jgi:two pore calcium channel protein